jgi:hypothetical protein
MDNGLIFPYRRCNDPAEASDAKHASRAEPSGDVSMSLRPDLVVGKLRSDAGR